MSASRRLWGIGPVVLLTFILALGAGSLCAETFTGGYVDGSNVYHTPSKSSVMKNGAAWTAGNLVFGNPSSAGKTNLPGAVLVTLSNVTGASQADFEADAYDSQGVWHRLCVRYDGRLGNLDAAVSTRSTETSVSAIPTNPLLASVYTAPDNASIAAIKAVTDSIRFYNNTAVRACTTNAGGAVTILPFQGAASYETVAQGSDVHVTYGDSVSIPYSIGKDITGWTVWFGAKSDPTSATYDVPLREVTAQVTDAAAGSGLINLSTADTAIPVKRYYAELQIRNGASVNTALKFYLWIDQATIW